MASLLCAQNSAGQFREAALVIARNSWTIHLANKGGDIPAPVYLEDLDDEIYPSIKCVR